MYILVSIGCSITYGSLKGVQRFSISIFSILWPCNLKLAVYWYATFWHYQGVLDHKKVNFFVVKFCFSFRCKHTPLYVDERRKIVSEAIHLDILCNSFNQVYEDVYLMCSLHRNKRLNKIALVYLASFRRNTFL